LMAADKEIDQEALRLIETLQNLNVPVVMVSNEVGLGIVPDNKLARDFRDHAGLLNQQVAAMADRVVFIAAGLPLTLKE
ncbi:MAG: bifunctional adenosylcobinamide kinase/adenosylcobinamide-phosphate guanylyltransferase, partial [Rhodospirillales bacterium]|nr:bifunctional adenosylcobinamide kinase/adenosylcobinamide-phosphate guanylyltransferase [Rhodospirillales bacterium]